MRWDQDHESPDVIDRRGESSGPGFGGLLPFLPFLLRSPWGWLVLLGVGGWFVFSSFFRGVTGDRRHAHGGPSASGRGAPETKASHFAGFVLDDVQGTWTRQFASHGKTYRHTRLVLFTNATPTGCGYGRAATGPFYCPADQLVYLDLGFFQELSERFGASGDFAQAYVLAHEVGHHVQHLLGRDERVAGSRSAAEGANGASVRLELQADCYAGVWAHSTAQRQLLEGGDLDEALRAAAAVGDDRLQRQSTGAVRPETWTHGSSAQRARWFRQGYDGGKPEGCDTFAAGDL